jgi:hypothetical protein
MLNALFNVVQAGSITVAEIVKRRAADTDVTDANTQPINATYPWP